VRGSPGRVVAIGRTSGRFELAFTVKRPREIGQTNGIGIQSAHA